MRWSGRWSATRSRSVWLYLASELSLKLHGAQSYHAFPRVLRSGGLIAALGPELGGRKTSHPETGGVTLSCPGFNHKNDCDRQSPCDQDWERPPRRPLRAGRRNRRASRGVHYYVAPLALVMLGRNDEAARLSREVDLSATPHTLARCFYASVRALAEGNRAGALEATRQGIAAIPHGPEERYPALAADGWLDTLRSSPGFHAVAQRAGQRHQEAVRMFAQAGGERLLGVKVRQAVA